MRMDLWSHACPSPRHTTVPCVRMSLIAGLQSQHMQHAHMPAVSWAGVMLSRPMMRAWLPGHHCTRRSCCGGVNQQHMSCRSTQKHAAPSHSLAW